CPSGIIGPGFYRHTPTTHSFELAMRGQLPALPPFTFSYVDIRDVVKAHLMAYENERAAGRYIVSHKTLSMLEMMKMMKEIDSTLKVPTTVIPASIMGIVPYLEWVNSKLTGAPRQLTSEMVEDFKGKNPYVSTAKIERELGWKPMNFKESVRDTLDWIRKVF